MSHTSRFCFVSSPIRHSSRCLSYIHILSSSAIQLYTSDTLHSRFIYLTRSSPLYFYTSPPSGFPCHVFLALVPFLSTISLPRLVDDPASAHTPSTSALCPIYTLPFSSIWHLDPTQHNAPRFLGWTADTSFSHIYTLFCNIYKYTLIYLHFYSLPRVNGYP